ncbi:hypothetical protein KY341_02820 [Candidatus Woesearchaeota archaeon]|nr:hypothetical protein [Candidatus Woesearchaeota archaeon]
MRNKVLVIFTSMLLLFSVLLLSSCKPSEPELVVYPHICGDGVCSADELGLCDFDCDLNLEPEPVIITPADVLEDLRSRIRNYSPVERLGMGNPVVESDDKIFVESFVSYLPEKGFRIASRHNLLSIGENISDVMAVLHKFHLREILRSGRLSSNTEAFGPRAAMYEQFLRLRTGKVDFGLDEYEEIISTFLLFEEEEPILDYIVEMKGGIFKFFEGEEINFLGHKYFIEEVTNTSMRLVGVTTPDTILFRHKHGVWVNDIIIPNTVLNVTLRHDYLRVTLVADEDIRILPGTGLRAYLIRPEAMLTNRLDLVYEGLMEVPEYDIIFDQSSGKFKLDFTSNKNLSYKIPFALMSPIKTGSEKYDLVYKEGSDKYDYFIEENDYFIINNKKEYKGLTNIIRLLSVKDNVILFEDPALEKFYVYYEGTPGVNATAELIVDNVVHKVYIGPNDTISVDLDGNGRIGGDNVPIVTAGNGIIKIKNVDNNTINFSIITPKQMRENENTDLEIRIVIDKYRIKVNKEDLELFKMRGESSLIGMSDYGALFIISRNIDEDEQGGQDLSIKYPIVQRVADVLVKGYE